MSHIAALCFSYVSIVASFRKVGEKLREMENTAEFNFWDGC